MANKRQRLAPRRVSESTTSTTTTDDGGAGTVLKVKSHKIAKAKRKAVRSDEKTGGSKRKPGKKLGDGCFICKSTDHVARACPHKLGKDRKKPLPSKVPRTLENTREQDETIAQPDDDELHAEDAADEFSAHFNHERTPQLLITSSRWCSTITIKFIAELLRVLPNAHYYKRGSYELKQIVKYAKNRDFTAIIVIHDNRKEPNGMLLINLPEGPTAHFKLSNTELSKKIKGHGKPTSHLPELILNNFTTRIGHRVGRMLASLFPQHPNFRGRRAVTFHNQRDFIFFRHHRYIFEAKEVKESAAKVVSKVEGSSKESGGTAKKSHKEAVITRLQECGPRFTMKLLSLQHGTFNSKFGEYEWVHKADMDTSRRRFFM